MTIAARVRGGHRWAEAQGDGKVIGRGLGGGVSDGGVKNALVIIQFVMREVRDISAWVNRGKVREGV